MRKIGERGAVTVAIAGLIFILMALFSFTAVAVGILVNKHKLNSATDLAALSAAVRLPQIDTSCQQAEFELNKSGFILSYCDGSDDWITVGGTTEIRVFTRPITLSAQATAGW